MRTKDVKGITIISLVVTIVVILILAGVTINVLVGDNGLIKQSKDKTSQAYEKIAREEVKQIVTEYDIANSGESLEEYLKKKVPSRLDEVKRIDDNILEVKKNGYTIEVESNRKEFSIIVVPYTGVYDGKMHNALQSVDVTPSDAKIEYSTDGKTFSENMPKIINASSLNVTVRVSKTGYKTTTVTKVAKIDKTEGKLTLSATSGTINYPNSTTFTVSGNTGTLSVSSSNTSVATVSISGSTVTVKSVGAGSATITVKSAASTNYNEKTATYTVTVKNPTFTADSGVGYYADTDGDGTPDGIIFEDFSKADSGSWCYKGDYSINEVTDLKEYYISEIGYKGPFGTKDVLRAKSENGNNRFYVMALEDVDNNTYGYWDAQNKVNGVWIVPPKNEWAAFATKLGITKSNYTTYKLAANYWSSTREPDWTGSFGAWQIEFSEWTIDFLDKKNTYHVRLATTF